MKVVGADRVQQRPDMIVAGALVEPEQRLAVRPPLSRLQTTLMCQERRALQEEQGKRRHVSHRIAHVASLPEVRQRVAHPRNDPRSRIFMTPDKPPFRGCENPPKSVPALFPSSYRDPQALSQLTFSRI